MADRTAPMIKMRYTYTHTPIHTGTGGLYTTAWRHSSPSSDVDKRRRRRGILQKQESIHLLTLSLTHPYYIPRLLLHKKTSDYYIDDLARDPEIPTLLRSPNESGCISPDCLSPSPLSPPSPKKRAFCGPRNLVSAPTCCFFILHFFFLDRRPLGGVGCWVVGLFTVFCSLLLLLALLFYA